MYILYTRWCFFLYIHSQWRAQEFSIGGDICYTFLSKNKFELIMANKKTQKLLYTSVHSCMLGIVLYL